MSVKPVNVLNDLLANLRMMVQLSIDLTGMSRFAIRGFQSGQEPPINNQNTFAKYCSELIRLCEIVPDQFSGLMANNHVESIKKIQKFLKPIDLVKTTQEPSYFPVLQSIEKALRGLEEHYRSQTNS